MRATAELPKMAAIIQVIGRKGGIQPSFITSFDVKVAEHSFSARSC